MAFDAEPGGLEARRRVGHVAGRRNDDLPLNQLGVVVGRDGRRRGPRVRAEVVVIAAGGHEQRAGIAPYDFVEPEGVVVERGGLVDVAHI